MLSPLRNRTGRGLREPFGKAGLTVAVIALVFAMLGGAYAATGNGGKATASAKAKKGPPGPRGKTGPAGPAGPAGSAGPAGEAGAKGDTGAVGPEGPQGKDGPQGKQGIQGKQGEAGKDGTTGFTDTLPSGKTETGVWAFQGGEAVEVEGSVEGLAVVPASFNIPLPSKLTDSTQVKKQGDAQCTGTVEKPTAAAGFFCIYTKSLSNALSLGAQTNSVAGVSLFFFITEFGPSGSGSWAVTAP